VELPNIAERIMSKPITDQAEVSIDFPDKFFIGSFGRGSRYEVTADKEGVHLHLDRQSGEKRHVGFHVHYYLLAELLEASAEAIAKVRDLEPHQKQRLREAAKAWGAVK
jgi:hypothetical protein